MLRLKEVRKSKGYTQDALADFLGVSRPTYTRYEQGTRECSFETLLKIADFFAVSVDYLLGREVVTKDHPNPEIAKLLRKHGIKKLQLLEGYSVDDVQRLVELGEFLRNK